MSHAAAALAARHPDTKVFTHNTHAFINAVLDNPKQFEATKGLREMGKFCPAYKARHVGEKESEKGWMDFRDKGCEYPVKEYFWLNGLHPTFPVHRAMAEELVGLLKG